MAGIKDQLLITDTSSTEGLASDIQRHLNRIQDRLDQMEGRRGTPTFHSDVDLNGNKISGLGNPVNSTDAATYGHVTSQQIPIGFCLISTVATDPADLLGYGTWELTSEGLLIAGYKSGDADFGTLGKTGGSKTADVSHTHTINHTHGTSSAVGSGAATIKDAAFTGTSGSGGSTTQSILPPYQVFYIWKRTA